MTSDLAEKRPVVYTGIHVLSLAKSLPTVMVSANRLVNRRSDYEVNRWIMDSGAFSRISSGVGKGNRLEEAEEWTDRVNRIPFSPSQISMGV